VEDEFGPLEKMKIPNSDNPIRIIRRVRILVIRSYRQLWELTRGIQLWLHLPWRSSHFVRPVEIGDGPTGRPSFIRERAEQLDFLSLSVIAAEHQQDSCSRRTATHNAPSRPMV
jgi:hypothetical protein